jgi:hypothetical protein
MRIVAVVAACTLAGCGTLTDYTLEAPDDTDEDPPPSDDDEDEDDGELAWDDGFESGQIDGAWVLDGLALWDVWSSASREGTYCAISGAILDGQATHIGLVVDTPDGGEVSFWHAGSTETGFDFLSFSIDGVENDSWSGVWSWHEAVFVIPPGIHNLRWSYTKDISQSFGQDGVLIDDVLILGGRP